MCTVADTRIEIDDEFEAIQRILTDDEFQSLKESIDADGRFTDELLYWREGDKRLLIDGHQRLRVWKSLPLNTIIPPPHVREVSLPDRHAVRKWIYRRQLSRRNLDKDDASHFRALLYEEVAQDVGGNKKTTNNGKSAEESPKRHNDVLVESGKTAAQIVAAETGVSASTVDRDVARERALNAIAAVNAKAAADIREKRMSIPKKDVIAIGKLDPTSMGTALANVRNGKKFNDGLAPPKKKATKKPKAISPAKAADDLSKKYISPLVKGIDKLAEINGGQGEQWEAATAALDSLITALSEMRGGAK